MNKKQNKVAIITGASSGIGLLVGEILSNYGWKVFSLSREEKKHPKIKYIKCDIASEFDVKKIIDEIFIETHRIDVLINNSGYAIYGPIEFTPLTEMKKMFDINLYAAMNVSNATIPYLRMVKGRIINIGSMAANFPIPFEVIYSMSKNALRIYSSGLSMELAKFKIKVIVIAPSQIQTKFSDKRINFCIDKSNHYGLRVKNNLAYLNGKISHGIKPLKVAKKIVRIIYKKHTRFEYRLRLKDKLIYFFSKFVSQKFLLKRLYKKYGR